MLIRAQAPLTLFLRFLNMLLPALKPRWLFQPSQLYTIQQEKGGEEKGMLSLCKAFPENCPHHFYSTHH